MSKPVRKTVEVGKMLNIANHFLAAKNTTADEREGVIALIETMLFETGNYNGYIYLDTEEVDGAGSRRRYLPSRKIRDDYEIALRDINKIRV